MNVSRCLLDDSVLTLIAEDGVDEKCLNYIESALVAATVLECGLDLNLPTTYFHMTTLPGPIAPEPVFINGVCCQP